jgi:hypothetical protein
LFALFSYVNFNCLFPNIYGQSHVCNFAPGCSRCNSFEDASMLLEELRLFDNQVYGVAHGLLMGYRENVWVQAQSLFDEVKLMDSSTASAFYNALTDMLWHFGQVSFSHCYSLSLSPSAFQQLLLVFVCTCLFSRITLVQGCSCIRRIVITPQCSC